MRDTQHIWKDTPMLETLIYILLLIAVIYLIVGLVRRM